MTEFKEFKQIKNIETGKKDKFFLYDSSLKLNKYERQAFEDYLRCSSMVKLVNGYYCRGNILYTEKELYDLFKKEF